MKLETMLAGCVVAGSLFANGTNVWNVADFGAREADTLQTEAIQRAIDACFTAGGGEVRVPEGVYYTGGIRLRSRVTLHLMSGAVLKGSRNPDDYEGWRADTLDPIPPATAATNGLPRSSVPQSRWCNGLIRAYGAHDIAIIGEPHSVIDGQNCFDPTGEEKYRGPHAISMWYCTNVVLRGYTVCDSANWAHAIFNSSNIAARALKVMGGHDGFDVRTCDDVRVESCVFQTGDDGIAGFDNIGVVVRDCVLDSACSAFRRDGRADRELPGDGARALRLPGRPSDGDAAAVPQRRRAHAPQPEERLPLLLRLPRRDPPSARQHPHAELHVHEPGPRVLARLRREAPVVLQPVA